MTQGRPADDPAAYRKRLFDLAGGRSDQYVVVNREKPAVAYGPFSEQEAEEFLATASHFAYLYGPDYWLRLPLSGENWSTVLPAKDGDSHSA